MNSAEKLHWDGDSSVSSVLQRSPVFRISKPLLSKFITASSKFLPHCLTLKIRISVALTLYASLATTFITCRARGKRVLV
jgi:hypothetical protein